MCSFFLLSPCSAVTLLPAHLRRQQPIPSPLPEGMGPNFFGYIAIFTLTVSLISSTMFSEAVWQRVWASATPRALYGGAAVGFVSITLIVFLSGFGGWLAFVWGYASFEAGTNPNTYLMQVRGEAQRVCRNRLPQQQLLQEGSSCCPQQGSTLGRHAYGSADSFSVTVEVSTGHCSIGALPGWNCKLQLLAQRCRACAAAIYTATPATVASHIWKHSLVSRCCGLLCRFDPLPVAAAQPSACRCPSTRQQLGWCVCGAAGDRHE